MQQLTKLVAFSLLVLAGASLALADTLEWTTATDGDFDDAANWTVTVGASSPPPAAGDSIFLNEVGTYSIMLTQDEAADFLRTTSGTVSLLSEAVTPRTLDLTTGSADLSVRGGGTLNIGSASNPVVVKVGDRLEVAHGAGGGAGTINLAGTATQLDVQGATTHNFGISGQVARVNVDDDSTLSFAVGSTLAIGQSGSNSSDGRFSISGGGDFVAGNIDIATLTSNAFGSVTVSGTGSTATQLGAATLSIGSTTGGQGILTIDNQASFQSDETNVNPTGRVNIASGGVFNVGGRLTIEQNAELAIDAGTLDTSAASNLEGPLINGLLLVENASTVTAGGFQALAVGAGGVGAMEVRSGSVVMSDFGSVGSIRDSVAGDGTVLIDGTGSSWEVTGEFVGNLSVGSSAQGSLTIQNGGLALGDNVEIGNLAGSMGDVTVDGLGSRFESTDLLTIGDLGTGSLLAQNQAEVVVAQSLTVGDEGAATTTIQSSATLTTSSATIGFRNGSNGDVIIDDADWTSTAAIEVGREGTGTLTIRNGASVTSNTGVVGAAIGGGGPGDGSLSIHSGASWTTTGLFTVGSAGTGTATISDGGQLTSGSGRISANNSATGDVTVTGTASAWTNMGDLTIGQGGTGNLLVSDGATATNVNASIGASSSVTTATVVVEDAGSLWVTSGDLFVAGTSSSPNGNHGDITVRSGGTAQVDGSTTVYGNGSVTVAGGTLNANGGLDNAAGGTLNLTSGALNVLGGAFVPNSGGDFSVANDIVVTLGSGATSDVTGELAVLASAGARLTLEDGAQVTSQSGLIDGGGSLLSTSPAPTATVEGSGTAWDIAGDLRIGRGLAAKLIVDDGAAVSNESGIIGKDTLQGGGLSALPASVEVAGAGSTWTNTESLLVGELQRSKLTIRDQATVTVSAGLSVPARIGFGGLVEVDGAGSTFAIDGELLVFSGATLIGDDNQPSQRGALVTNGGSLTAATATLTTNAIESQIGDRALIRVEGPGSSLAVTGHLAVGQLGNDGGSGNLQVADSGLATSDSAAVGFVGDEFAGNHTRRVLVTGAGSQWNNAGDLAIGGDLTTAGGSGEVVLEDAGLLSVGGGLTVWDAGTLTLNGGALRLDSSLASVEGTLTFNAGTLILTDATGYTVGSGEAIVEDLIGDTAAVLSTGKSLRVENTLMVPAGTSITHVGGELSGDTLVNNGLVNVNSTTVTTTNGLDNDSQLVLIDATVDGPVDNAAGATTTVLGSVIFNGPVTGPGEFFGPGVSNFAGVVSLGASPAEVGFEGSVALGETSELVVELQGTSAGDFDRLVVGGDLSLSGDLRVELLNGFAPELGDVFEFARVDGAMLGQFDTELMPDLGPLLELRVHYTANTATLAVSPALAGDYNADGVVDSADYTVWRDSLNEAGIGLAADGDSNGVVDVDDYLVWQNHYGTTASSALQDAASVPEPAAFYLASVLLILPFMARRRVCESVS